jgi:hypothetical protein
MIRYDVSGCMALLVDIRKQVIPTPDRGARGDATCEEPRTPPKPNRGEPAVARREPESRPR